jgi:hypothetical protein
MEDGSPFIDVTPLAFIIPMLVCLFCDWRASRAAKRVRAEVRR